MIRLTWSILWFQDEFVTSQLLLWPHNLLNTSYYWYHILSEKRLRLTAKVHFQIGMFPIWDTFWATIVYQRFGNLFDLNPHATEHIIDPSPMVSLAPVVYDSDPPSVCSHQVTSHVKGFRCLCNVANQKTPCGGDTATIWPACHFSWIL